MAGQKAIISSIPIRVTAVTGAAVVRVPGYATMVIVHRILIVVLVAIDAAERAEITRGRMAFHAGVPFSIVGPAINPEILGIMIES